MTYQLLPAGLKTVQPVRSCSCPVLSALSDSGFLCCSCSVCYSVCADWIQILTRSVTSRHHGVSLLQS
jgi:hypothetical protein